jgi:conserved oligomeric Golgi complex subunit 3
LAQEAISVCRQSLLAASELIKSRSQLDGLLFLVRHLLILKEITRSLDIVQKEDHGDFGAVGVTGAVEPFGFL